MKYVVFLIILLIFMIIIEKISNKILGVKKKKISETPGKKIDRWGRGIILVIFLITLWPALANDSDLILKAFWMGYLTLLTGFQAILEFIYLKGSKQYITTIALLLVGLTILYNIENFL